MGVYQKKNSLYFDFAGDTWAAAAAASPFFSLSILAAMAPSWEALALLSLLLALPDSSSPAADSGGGGSGRHGHSAFPASAVDAGEKKTIHLAGIFPINGIEGWQGGQVRAEICMHSLLI